MQLLFKSKDMNYFNMLRVIDHQCWIKTRIVSHEQSLIVESPRNILKKVFKNMTIFAVTSISNGP